MNRRVTMSCALNAQSVRLWRHQLTLICSVHSSSNSSTLRVGLSVLPNRASKSMQSTSPRS